MTPLTRTRRVAVALASLALAAVLFRGELATALVTRGDDLLRAGDLDGAVRAYGRAARLDARSAVASDRLAFFLLVRRGKGDAARAYAIAADTLRSVPADPALLADRAFAAQRLARWRDAERDFLRAARLARDPRYAHLAARDAVRAGDAHGGRVDLRFALALDPRYAPARMLLREGGA
jgi:tetratricopeptide (TPR) repeat protein